MKDCDMKQKGVSLKLLYQVPLLCEPVVSKYIECEYWNLNRLIASVMSLNNQIFGSNNSNNNNNNRWDKNNYEYNVSIEIHELLFFLFFFFFVFCWKGFNLNILSQFFVNLCT